MIHRPSKELIIERDVGVILLVVHNVPKAVDSHLHADPVDVVLVPFVVILAQGLEVVVALGEVVARHVGVEVMDVVVFDAAAEELQEEAEGKVGASFEGGTRVAPLFGPGAVTDVD